LAFSLLLNVLLLSPTFSQTVVGTITRPGLAPSGLAVYEAGNKLCVFDDRTNHLLIYDGATLALEKEIIFSQPISDPFSCSDMAVNETEGKLYICIGTENWPEKGVIIAIVDLVGDLVSAEISLPGLLPQTTPRFIYDQLINKIFIANLIVDLNSNAVTQNNLFSGGVLNPVTHEVFEENTNTGKLRIINLITNEISEVDAIENVADMTVNWLENKVYLLRYPGSAFWIYDRDDGSTKIINHDNDSESLVFNPGSNLVYTSAEIACRSTIVDGGSDNYYYLLMEGGAPSMAFCHATKHAYFAGNHFIAVFDETSQMLEKIDFAHPHAEKRSGIQYIAVNQTTGRVFVTSVMFYDAPDDNPIWVLQDSEMMTRPNVLLGGDLVTVLDPENHAIQDYWGVVTETGWGDETVEGMTYNPDGSRAYVVSRSTYYSDTKAYLSAHAGSGAWDKKGRGAGNENAKVGSCVMDGQIPITPVSSSDGSKIYVTCSATNLVQTVDVTVDSNLHVIKKIEVGKTPWGAALTPEGAQLYVANKGSNNVSVINTASGIVTGSIPVGTAPWGLGINPSGMLAYVANSGSGTVSVIDIAANSVITNIQVGSNPHWLSFTPDGKFAYITNNNSGSVSVVDAGTHQVIRTIRVGSHPEGLCFYPDGSRVYIATDSGASIINTSNFSVNFFSDLSKNPFGEIYGPYYSVAVANPSSRFAGRVTNLKGLPVVNALVRATQEGVEKGTATTNAAGDFCLFYLQSGIYDLELSGPDLPPQSLMAQQVNAGQTKIVHFSVPTSIKTSGESPRQFSLGQNYPNPFNPSTEIEYSLPISAQVVLKVIDILGHEVKILVKCKQTIGTYRVQLDGKGLSSGLYFYLLQAGKFTAIKKMILIK
jgi:YVTN family beta-propeller protein